MTFEDDYEDEFVGRLIEDKQDEYTEEEMIARMEQTESNMLDDCDVED